MHDEGGSSSSIASRRREIHHCLGSGLLEARHIARQRRSTMRRKKQPSLSSHSTNQPTMSLVAMLILSCQMVMGFAPLSTTRITPSKALRSAAATEMPEGFIKTVTKPGNGPPLKLGDIASVKYSCYLPDEAPFARSEFQKVVRSSSSVSVRGAMNKATLRSSKSW